jgi:hypothetical protein
MTWVVGAASPVGFAVALSDVCVSFGEERRDCLRKIYPVAPGIAIDFQPEAAPINKAVSIGCGSEFKAYADCLDRLSTNDPLIFMKGEEMNRKLGSQGLEMILSSMLSREPLDGVSPHLHLCEVRRGEIRIGTNDRTTYPPNNGPVIEFKMPPVANSPAEFDQLAKQFGWSAVGARC